MHSRKRGFTMIEVLTVVAILGVLAAMASTAIYYGMGRARMSNTLFDISALLSVAQLRSISHGTPHYVIFHRNEQGRLRASLVERPSADDSDINWNSLDLSNGLGEALAYNEVDPVTGAVTTRNAFEREFITLASASGPDEGGISFVDPDAATIELPPPFSAIAATTPYNASPIDGPTTELRAGCTFCISGGGSEYGVIRYNSDGTVTMRTGAEVGGLLSFMSNTAEGKDVGFKLLVISAPAGVVRIIQQ
jgi:prepilin-type N-terminal cleavage/methylation domain-containing protein